MGKANCPFCNSGNTFNIAYGYLGEKKTKKNYINQEDIGLIVFLLLFALRDDKGIIIKLSISIIGYFSIVLVKFSSILYKVITYLEKKLLKY